MSLHKSAACHTQRNDNLVTKVAERYQVPRKQVIAQGKNRKACLAREVVWYICKTNYDLPSRVLGEHFAGRNPKTVWKGVKAVSDEMEVNPDRKQEVAELMAAL